MLAAGGIGDDIYSAEIYEPGSDRWTEVGHGDAARRALGLLALDDGRAIYVSGYDGTSETFDPTTRTWSPSTATFPGGPSSGSTVATLPGGRVLASGGLRSVGENQFVGRAETALLGGAAWTPAADMRVARAGHVLVPLRTAACWPRAGRPAAPSAPSAEMMTSAPTGGRTLGR